MKQVIFSKEAPAAVGPYSHAIDCGNLVFLSGQVPLVPETGALRVRPGRCSPTSRPCFKAAA